MRGKSIKSGTEICDKMAAFIYWNIHIPNQSKRKITLPQKKSTAPQKTIVHMQASNLLLPPRKKKSLAGRFFPWSPGKCSLNIQEN